MAKVTLNDNLVPCERTVSAPFIDLTENVDVAGQLAQAATRHFFLRRYSAVFSGYIANEPGEFAMELWHEGQMLRSFLFTSLSYSGAMYIDVVPGLLKSAVGFDLLGDLQGVGVEATGLVCKVSGPQMSVAHRPVQFRSVVHRSRRPRTRREAVDRLIELLER